MAGRKLADLARQQATQQSPQKSPNNVQPSAPPVTPNVPANANSQAEAPFVPATLPQQPPKSTQNRSIGAAREIAAEYERMGMYREAALERKSAARMQAEADAPDGRLLGIGDQITRIANSPHPLNIVARVQSAGSTIADKLEPALETRRDLIDYTTQLKLKNNVYLYDDYAANAYRMGGYEAMRQAQLGYDPRFVPEHIRGEVAAEVDMLLMLPVEPVAEAALMGASRYGRQLLQSGRLNPLNYRISPHGVYGGVPVPEVRFTGRGAFGRTPVVSRQTALDWTIVSKKTGETRIQHVITQHGDLNFQKPLQGVFYGDPVGAINDAWRIGRLRRMRF